MRRAWLAFFALLTLVACSPKYIDYQSTAGIPLLSQYIASDLTYIPGPPSRNNHSIGVFACIDNDKLCYLLVAPKIGAGVYMSSGRPARSASRSPFDTYDIGHGVPILADKATELIDAIRDAHSDWVENYPLDGSKFIEYKVAQEHEVVPLAENVARWYPSLLFKYRNVKSKSSAELVLGHGPLFRRIYVVKKRKELAELGELMQMGLDVLGEKGCN